MIPKNGRNALGLQVAEGYYAVSPAGFVVLLPPNAPLKPGFRWATEADLDPQPAKVATPEPPSEAEEEAFSE